MFAWEQDTAFQLVRTRVQARSRLHEAPRDSIITQTDQDAIGISRVEGETIGEALSRSYQAHGGGHGIPTVG